MGWRSCAFKHQWLNSDRDGLLITDGGGLAVQIAVGSITARNRIGGAGFVGCPHPEGGCAVSFFKKASPGLNAGGSCVGARGREEAARQVLHHEVKGRGVIVVLSNVRVPEIPVHA